MFRRRARADRKFRDAQRAGQAMLAMHGGWQPPDGCGPAAVEVPAVVEADFLPPDFRAPSRQDVSGFMMRWEKPLVIDGEVRQCPACGSYRDWVVFCMRDDSVWLRCKSGHETKESGLDAAWYNRNSGPADHFHPTLEEGLRHLGH
ncbi:hypothetical protein [Streptomyces sp. A5-4]|uniref:hypothetical protein n=1 Tax=Streptomyces sp. A5-4 TaxID=3384771 RepID=UPI003DA89678